MSQINRIVQESLWARIEPRSFEECWPWRGMTTREGYPTLYVAGRVVSALRLLYELAIGELPAKRWVRHSCETPGCMNPAHLYLTAHKGALVRPTGARAPRAKLSEAAAREIIQAEGTVTAKELAARYGISARTVADIWQGKSWQRLRWQMAQEAEAGGS